MVIASSAYQGSGVADDGLASCGFWSQVERWGYRVRYLEPRFA